MLTWMDAAARHVMALADQESDRLSHDYLGNEHILVGLAQAAAGAVGPTAAGAAAQAAAGGAARALEIRGLDAVALRVELDCLVDRGVLPAAWRRNADLMRSVGIDLSAVRRSMEDTFGVDAVNQAVERTTRRTGWTPLGAKALMVKQSLQFAGELAGRTALVRPEHLLLGVLADARNPIEKPRCFNNPWARNRRSRLGLPHRGPSPVRLIVEARGWPPEKLHDQILDELLMATGT